MKPIMMMMMHHRYKEDFKLMKAMGVKHYRRVLEFETILLPTVQHSRVGIGMCTTTTQQGGGNWRWGAPQGPAVEVHNQHQGTHRVPAGSPAAFLHPRAPLISQP